MQSQPKRGWEGIPKRDPNRGKGSRFNHSVPKSRNKENLAVERAELVVSETRGLMICSVKVSELSNITLRSCALVANTNWGKFSVRIEKSSF